MLEGPHHAQSSVSRSFIMHRLRNQHVSIGQFLNMKETTIVFCAGSRPKKRTKT